MRLPIVALGVLFGAFGRLGEPADAAALRILVQDPAGHAVPHAVLLLHALARPPHPPAPVRAVMDQIHRAFVPDVLVIPVGSTVIFPNTDTTRHEVYSFSPAHRFQLPLYRGKPYPPEHFDRAGIVTLGCNIHDDMLAYIVVTDAELFGSTDGAGRWSEADVPPGRYRVEMWHPRLADQDSRPARELTVDQGSMSMTFVLPSALRPAPLSGRPHSWDAY